MKKIYLSFLAAAASLSAFAAEPALTEVWSKIYDYQADAWGYSIGTEPNWSATEGVMGTATGSRYGVGMDGKVYAINGNNNSLISFDADGMNPTAVKLPSQAGKTIYYYDIASDLAKKTVPDFYATLLTRDDAGHFIVGHGFTTGAMVANWTVLDPKTGDNKTFYQDDFGFVGVDPNKAVPDAQFIRIDAVGRVLGDATYDGVFYMAPTSIFWSNINGKSWSTAENVQGVKIMTFGGNGKFDDDLNVAGYVTPWVTLGNQTKSICQPLFNDMDEFWDFVGSDPKTFLEKASQSYILYSKAEGQCLATNQYAAQFGVEEFIDNSNAVAPGIAAEDRAATDIIGTNASGYAGFDTFTIGGKRYYVTNYQTAEEYKITSGMMQLGVFDEKGMLIAKWSNPGYASGFGYCSISVEPVADDENSYYIYAYCATAKLDATNAQAAAAAQLKFTAGDQAGIDNIAVDETAAPAVYYNLQGVQVANPENGIFVVRRGNKVTKEIVK